MKTTGALLLLLGGLVHLVPALYEWLTELTGGTEWIQMIVGAVSVVVALTLFIGKEPHKEIPHSPAEEPRV
ncbi:MAG: hypothetical protein WCV86_02485 [Patescibacteria group bacterium]|jgi:thiosulfate reductase cytochrome b subunit